MFPSPRNSFKKYFLKIFEEYLDIQIYGKINTEVIRISEYFPSNARPLFCDFANLRDIV